MTPQESINRLLARGLTEAQVADIAGVSQPTVNRIKRGRGCSFEVGRRLIDAESRMSRGKLRVEIRSDDATATPAPATPNDDQVPITQSQREVA